ncbi:MAG: nucleotidyltransferase domain-containing protein [Aigarchaeota archaeon]|nr:nucleotidyltransferase domain-containing protein [Candidatus Pelearchaeum maunauluense]
MSFKDKLRIKALELAREFMEKISQQKIKVRSIVLFGSYVRGDFTENSDIDICLIGENLPSDELERRSMRGFYSAPKLSVIAYTPDEFLTMLKDLNPVVMDIVHEGLALFDDGFFDEARQLFRELQKKYSIIRDGKAWRWRQEAY